MRVKLQFERFTAEKENEKNRCDLCIFTAGDTICESVTCLERSYYGLPDFSKTPTDATPLGGNNGS